MSHSDGLLKSGRQTGAWWLTNRPVRSGAKKAPLLSPRSIHYEPTGHAHVGVLPDNVAGRVDADCQGAGSWRWCRCVERLVIPVRITLERYLTAARGIETDNVSP